MFSNKGLFILNSVGINDATTFMGFCATHDAEMFRPIEMRTVELSAETAFLLSFRAIAYELFNKRAAVAMAPFNRELDKGCDFETQCEMQIYLHGYEYGLNLGLQDIQKWKAEYDAAYIERRFEEFPFYAIAFSGIVPIVTCGAFFPEYDFEGKALQKLGREGAAFECVAFNLTALQGRSVAVLTSIGMTDGPAKAFVDSFAAIPKEQQGDAAVRLAFNHLENTCVRPTWWLSLAASDRDALTRAALVGTGSWSPERVATDLMPDDRNYTSGISVVENVQHG